MGFERRKYGRPGGNFEQNRKKNLVKIFASFFFSLPHSSWRQGQQGKLTSHVPPSPHGPARLREPHLALLRPDRQRMDEVRKKLCTFRAHIGVSMFFCRSVKEVDAFASRDYKNAPHRAVRRHGWIARTSSSTSLTSTTAGTSRLMRPMMHSKGSSWANRPSKSSRKIFCGTLTLK